MPDKSKFQNNRAESTRYFDRLDQHAQINVEGRIRASSTAIEAQPTSRCSCNSLSFLSSRVTRVRYKRLRYGVLCFFFFPRLFSVYGTNGNREMPRICVPTANPPRWSTKQFCVLYANGRLFSIDGTSGNREMPRICAPTANPPSGLYYA